jgi:hypothetical protein
MQNQKNIQDLVEFLIEKPGYLKEGKRRLKILFSNKYEVEVSEDECAEAIIQTREYFRNLSEETIEETVSDIVKKVSEDFQNSIIITTTEESPITSKQFKVSKAWQNSSGKWLYSGEYQDTDLEASTEDFFTKAIDTLKESVKPFKIAENSFKSNNNILLVYTADKHVGALTKADSHYSNEYDFNVFFARMKQVYTQIFKAVSTYGKFKQIVFVDLGDALDGLDGKTTRGGHTLPQNMDNKEQFNSYINVHKILFDNMIQSNFADTYKFQLLTNDNHSGDLAYFANSMLKTYLDLKYPTVTHTTLQEKFIDHIKIENHCFIFTHGKDSEDLKFGFPMHLNDKTENYINKYIIEKRLSDYTCHFIKGDLHKHNSEQSTLFRYKNVASIYGSSKWIHNNFGNTKPGYSLEILDLDDNSITEKNLTINEA